MQYLIDVPPPTISGTLHLGHTFSYSHMDFMARYNAMKGAELVYPFCFDNNGLPTEKLGLAAGCKDNIEIAQHSVEVSDIYRGLFDRLGMAWASPGYNTHSAGAMKLANLSFDDLLAKGLLYKGESEYFFCPKTQTSVAMSEVDENGIYERSGAKVEVRRGEGWFVRVKDRMSEIRAAVNQIEWKPAFYKERLLQWLDSVEYDWSISRTRTWGIKMKADPQYVYDTWFTSSLSPQLAWSAKQGQMSLACPVFDARFQAHDIIRTWALFTIIKSLYHNDQIPWKTIHVSGHVLVNRMKMGKSSNNAVAPDTLIEKYGADGLRYWAAHASPGQDTRIDENEMLKGKKLANKLRNAKRFLDMGTDEIVNPAMGYLWQNAKGGYVQHMEDGNWAEAIKGLTTFFWDTFCSTWIESCKQQPCRGTLRPIFNEMIPLFGVFMPGIASELVE